MNGTHCFSSQRPENERRTQSTGAHTQSPTQVAGHVGATLLLYGSGGRHCTPLCHRSKHCTPAMFSISSESQHDSHLTTTRRQSFTHMKAFRRQPLTRRHRLSLHRGIKYSRTMEPKCHSSDLSYHHPRATALSIAPLTHVWRKGSLLSNRGASKERNHAQLELAKETSMRSRKYVRHKQANWSLLLEKRNFNTT